MTKGEWTLFIGGIALVLLFNLEGIVRTWNTKKPDSNHDCQSVVTYYKTVVEYTYNDLRKDTSTVDIYESPVLKLKEGDLTYWKISGATGGAVAGVTTLASYVRKFNVLSAEKM